MTTVTDIMRMINKLSAEEQKRLNNSMIDSKLKMKKNRAESIPSI